MNSGVSPHNKACKKTRVKGFGVLGLKRLCGVSLHVCMLRSVLTSVCSSCFKDVKNALGFEVRLSVREHLEARRLVSAEGAVYRAAGCTPTCLIREV